MARWGAVEVDAIPPEELESIWDIGEGGRTKRGEIQAMRIETWRLGYQEVATLQMRTSGRYRRRLRRSEVDAAGLILTSLSYVDEE